MTASASSHEAWYPNVEKTSQTDDQRIEDITVLPPPEHLIRFFPIRGTEVESLIGDTRRNIEKAFDGEPVKNVMIARYDISYIEKVFAPEDRVERIYINFCNPWTKRPKYAKRRLTHPRQLMQYREFLVDGGEIWFKTDDDALFEESLPYFDACGFELRYQTGDLHAAGVTPNYVSEHEMKFTALGVPIKFARFAKKPGKVELDPVRWVMPGAFAKLREDDETEEP